MDVYRRIGAVRTEPLGGASSFFQEALTKWRELNSAADWLAADHQLRALSQSLPQLLHHKEAAVDLLLAAVRPEAALSLPPVFDLLAVLARDLQQEYLPLLPRVLARCAASRQLLRALLGSGRGHGGRAVVQWHQTLA